MGYTHYWKQTAGEELRAAISDCAAIVAHVIANETVDLADGMGEGEPVANDKRVWINGPSEDDQGHETFGLSDDDSGFEFCKTARKPYDVVVVACLCALADRCGSAASVNSDGDGVDWEDGRALAEGVLGRSIANPIGRV